MGKIRGTHSSPGVYTQFTDLSYAANSLGITTLGLVGETKKGPAFEPIPISNWEEFQNYFGGTSPEKFKESQYPKYELPYVAKSYLKKSDQLYVCRVLGLSGYNAGPAFVITAENNDGKKYVVAVLRSRGTYKKYTTVGDPCNGGYQKYDTIDFDCDEVTIEPYTNLYIKSNCDNIQVDTDSTYNINIGNYGQFTLVAKKGGETVGKYSVTLNSGSKDYICNVIGTDAKEGSAAIFVEELYDLFLIDLIEKGEVVKISNGDEGIITIPEITLVPVTDPVSDMVTIPYTDLTKNNVGQTFLCNINGTSGSTGDTESVTDGFQYYDIDFETGLVDYEGGTTCMSAGEIYTVAVYVKQDGTKVYVYVPVYVESPAESGETGTTYTIAKIGKLVGNTVDVVKVIAYDRFFQLDINGDVVPTSDMNDYHEMFRCASTPWVVSNLVGGAESIQVKKMFRFHTISDGTAANSLVKISIANIDPDEGTFDVMVRDFNDSDGNPTILEADKGVTMVPGSKKYIGLQIGTLDGSYELKSKYIVVEIIQNDMTEQCVPAGFLGYPVRDYTHYEVEKPTFTYNTNYDQDIKDKRQYFGLSDITGVDLDMLFYKGKNAYTEEYHIGYTQPFHLDARLNDTVKKSLGTGFTVTIDGDETTADITWTTVNPNYSKPYTSYPKIATEEEMEGTLYENIKTRKFTLYPCGGFDGWDVYRGKRSNTDEFKASKYKGLIKNGYGATFSKINNAEALALSGNCITSDYYAYLAGVNQFEIPEMYTINLFATPGIDYVNNELLVNDVLDMVSEKRGDSLYVVTTPDKPSGASDDRDDMYTSADAVSNLDGTNIDTYYAATYYPWVKYFDADNSVYINLPATKDVVRNMADVDNKRFPWFAPAGIERGDVECTKMHFFAKLEDEDNLYDGRINPLKTFSEDGVKVWGNKTLYTGDTPMNRINVVRLMLYMRKLIKEACVKLIFEPNDTTLKAEFLDIIKPILSDIKKDRGITDFKVQVSQTPEQMDAHEMSAKIWVKPTPTLEYLEIEFVVTPQGVSFEEV